MSRFNGVAVYPNHDSGVVMVGVLLRADITQQQWNDLYSFFSLKDNRAIVPSIKKSKSGLHSVRLVVKIASKSEAREMAVALAKILKKMTRVQTTIRELQNTQCVIDALR
jgi:hypothetical protein